ncbi:hypothetical protein LCGC14_0142020 [marine sediment metagenome]|uniref:RsbT co-antagonist protein RsbRD N-terminal domain-containing protein n=1 Tax=marine sediment metagenome TaxID=412755 RepID=A0A0F9VGJ8_9ZZZZ
MSSLQDEKTVYRNELDRWIESLGLPYYQPSNTEVEDILGFTRESLRERSSTELSEDAVILSQYALFLQQKTNECKTFLRWSGQVVNRLFGDDKPKLNEWVRLAELRVERIAYLTRRIEMIGQSISGLVRARYNEGVNR